MLLSVNHRRHRVPQVDTEAPIPATLPPGEALAAELWIPSRALPARRSQCLIHSRGDITLEVNGRTCEQVHWRSPPSGTYRSEIFLEFVVDRDARPAREDCRVFRVDPTSLTEGSNRLTIVNTTSGELEIDRVNLALW